MYKKVEQEDYEVDNRDSSETWLWLSKLRLKGEPIVVSVDPQEMFFSMLENCGIEEDKIEKLRKTVEELLNGR